MEKILETF